MNSIEPVLRATFIFLYFSAGLWILLGIRPKQMSRAEKLFVAVLALELAVNLAVLLVIRTEMYAEYYPYIGILPIFFAFLIVSPFRFIQSVFLFLTAVAWVAPLLLFSNTAVLLFPGNDFLKLIVQILVAIPMLNVLHRYFRPSLMYLLRHFTRGWLLFCAVPFLCAFVSYHQTRYRFLYDPQVFQDTIVWQYGLSTLVFVTYLLIVKYAGQIREQLEAKNNYELVQTQLKGALQYTYSLKESQRQAAMYYHDLRHHFQHIHSLASENNSAGIMTYIAGIEKRIEDASLQTFCQNETVNLILSAFHQKADRQNIQLDIQADIPQKLSLPDADLCVIISNALENAVNATGKVTGRPKLIRFESHTKNDQLFLEISNPYEGDVQIVNGEPQSCGEGGIGTKSIALMVRAHGGLFNFEARNGNFILRIIL